MAAELAATLERERCEGRTVGLVPTMGALHDGHASLVERAAEETDVVAVSIYVNPLQFGPDEDLDAYPRPLETDLAVAEKVGATLAFVPPAEEMDGGVTRVNVGGPGEVLEALTRPGHLEGVATVVARLFALAGRCRAYFGEKDYQQLVVVRRLAADLGFPIEVIGCPTVREPDGLAVSSRNVYLSPQERSAAPVLLRALRAGAASLLAGERDPATVAALVADIVAAEPLASLVTADVVNAETLEPPSAPLSGDVRLLVAARLGRAMLIDN
ncbi:MAG: pantoate--beta-alanine ligase, partial [Acidimicrobiia bacterium]|nr:pantoate--beta-alanine ligase [Acidimicrobiia bacterium]